MIPALTSVKRRRRRRQLLACPYIINGIISMTLLTKQMHKSHRSESIDTETFNHVLNNDHCSHNAIIIFSLWFGWMRCQFRERRRGAIRESGAVIDSSGRRRSNAGGGRHLYVEWQLKSGCQKKQWIFAVLFISWLALNKSGGTCIACPSAFSSAP